MNNITQSQPKSNNNTGKTSEGKALQSRLNKEHFIDTEHLREWVEGSAVSEAIAALNIESISADEANKRVKPRFPIKDAGWWCRGVNWRNGQPMGNRYGQFKPNHPHHDPEKDKDAKYLTVSRMTPDAVFLKMPDDDYWQKVYENSSIPIFWTEGTKKAGAGLSIELETVALTGVWNWGKNNKLAPEVLTWIKRGGTQYLCFDSDYREKPSCREAIRRFCTLSREHGTEIKIVSWDSQHKGMDDFIKANGKEAFEERIKQAQTLEQWEKQFKSSFDDNKKTCKKPPADAIAQEIAEEYADKLAFNNETKIWMRYEAKCSGVWSPETDEYIEALIKQILDGKGITGYGSYS